MAARRPSDRRLNEIEVMKIITPGSAAAPVARGSVEVSVLAEGRLKPSNLVAV